MLDSVKCATIGDHPRRPHTTRTPAVRQRCGTVITIRAGRLVRTHLNARRKAKGKHTREAADATKHLRQVVTLRSRADNRIRLTPDPWPAHDLAALISILFPANGELSSIKLRVRERWHRRVR